MAIDNVISKNEKCTKSVLVIVIYSIKRYYIFMTIGLKNISFSFVLTDIVDKVPEILESSC